MVVPWFKWLVDGVSLWTSVSPCVICGEESGTGVSFLSQYYPAVAQYSRTHFLHIIWEMDKESVKTKIHRDRRTL